MSGTKLKIEYVDISQINPYENNAKEHPDWQVDQIVESIKEFGNCDPIGVWTNLDGNIEVVEGHGRLMALKEMGEKTAPVIYLDHLSDEQRRAYALVHNKLTMNTDWDFDALDKELASIVSEFDMGVFGFDVYADDVAPISVAEDDVPDDAPSVCKRGHVWRLGRHRLMCGDSTNENDINMLMEGAKAQCMFTDPPYGVMYQSNMRDSGEKFDVIKNDDVILDFMSNVKQYVDGFVFVCTSWKVISDWVTEFSKHYDITNMIIWDKGGGGIGDLKKTFSTDYEIILVSNNGHEILGKRIGSVWSVGKDIASSYVHPTQKPVGLSALAVQEVTRKDDIVLDVFGGSGSTLIACEQTGRTCYMMELDEHYCDVIIKRWEDFTGEKAELIINEEACI